MKALVKNRSARGLWLEDVAEPELGINDVKVRVLLTGICGTDLHIYDWDAWASATIQKSNSILPPSSIRSATRYTLRSRFPFSAKMSSLPEQAQSESWRPQLSSTRAHAMWSSLI